MSNLKPFEIGRLAIREDGVILGRLYQPVSPAFNDQTVYSIQDIMGEIVVSPTGLSSFKKEWWCHTLGEIITGTISRPGRILVTKGEWEELCKKEQNL